MRNQSGRVIECEKYYNYEIKVINDGNKQRFGRLCLRTISDNSNYQLIQ